MRDRMTARHSAAVARFAKATAAAAGLSPRDQELVHTAGPAARRRQVHVPRPHAHRHAPDRGGLGADPLAPAARRRHRRPRARLPGRRGDRALPPRADRRPRLPAPPRRRRHPGARPDPRGGGLLRRDDRARLLPHADGSSRTRSRSCGASPGTQLDARFVEIFVGVVRRPGSTSSTPTTTTSRPSCAAGPARRGAAALTRGARARGCAPATLVVPAHVPAPEVRFARRRMRPSEVSVRTVTCPLLSGSRG